MNTITIMREDRTIIALEFSKGLLRVLSQLGWVQAHDGVYVPSCDLAQYEAGMRPVATN